MKVFVNNLFAYVVKLEWRFSILGTEKSNRDEGNNGRNDFLQLVNDYFVNKEPKTITKEDLKTSLKNLLEIRLETPSKSFITSATTSVSMILGFLALYYALPEILNKMNFPFSDFSISVVGIIMSTIFFMLGFKIIRYKKEIENREMRIMRKYLTAIAELNEDNQE